MTKLPAEGRTGEPPAWPLPPDVVTQAKLGRLHEQIDEASLEAQGTGREAKNAARRLLSLRERAEILSAQMATLAEHEALLWAELWATPQAVAWERLKWTREVAQYVRWKIRAEIGDIEAAKEARFWSDRLGLNPVAMLRLRWEVATDEVAGQRAERTARTTATARSRRGLKAVDGAG
ncbi:hypothetical protein ACFQE5_22270 [Pseudonocardia hispaniensis]|uniref:DUF222 domain-containing protein n=1 Tax=Pseudonocardia hispaniensis TaxID=904933 RepID=A0ABW1J8U0_9PSEU